MAMTRAHRDTSPAERVYLPREGMERVPTFHARGKWTHVRDESDELRTRCGLLVYRYIVPDSAPRIRVTHLRLDHAEAFAVPCRRCWPDLEVPF